MKKVNISFGTIAAWAKRANYSVAYYKRAFMRDMPSLGRLSNTQGMPSLRCEKSFMIGAKNYAKALYAGEKSFFLNQDGLRIESIGDADFIQFSVKGAQIYAHSCRMDGRIYFIQDATTIELGGYYEGE